jgi:hypothetical protein
MITRRNFIKDGWRIADITWDGKDTLRGIFVKK